MHSPVNVNNLTRQLATPARADYCDDFFCRLRGLMFRRHLGRDEGLLLVEKRDSRLESSIHMFFVPFDLAVFWINTDLVVVDKVIAKTWHPAYVPKTAAKFTLEVHSGRFADYEIGDRVEIEHV